jgi:signal transduction histidine kinase
MPYQIPFRVNSICLLFSFVLSCQIQSQTDSLRSVYESINDPDEKLVVLNQLAWSIRRENLVSSDSMARAALVQAKELKNQNEIAVAKNTLAVIDIMNGRFPEAIAKLKECSKINLEQKAYKGFLDNEMNVGLTYYFQGRLDTAATILLAVSKLADSLDVQSTRAKILSNLGAIYQSMGKYQNALEASLECLEAATEMKDQELYSATAGNIGLLFDYMGNYEKAIYYQKQSIAIDSTLGDKSGMSYSYGNLGEIYRQMELWPKAFECYSMALEMATEIGDSEAISGQLMNVSLYYDHVGNLVKSRQLILQSLEISQRNGYPYQIALAHSQLGMTDLAENNVDGALRNLRLSLSMSLNQQIMDLVTANYMGLSEAFERAGNSDSSLHYLKLHVDISDSLKTEESKETIERLETQFRVLEKENEISELSAKQAQDALALAQQRNWIIGLIAMVLITLMGGWVIIDRRRKKAQEVLVAERLQFQKNMLDSTVLAQEEERQRIAKDLHDGLVQSLAALKLGVQNSMNVAGLSAEQKGSFSEHIKNIDTAAEEARNISHQMMPRALTETGLISAFEDMLSKTLKQTDIGYNFEQFGVLNQRFKPSIEIGLYRIAQELVNNILKHSGAKHVDIQLLKTKTHLVLHVEDDGKGFEFDKKGSQNGIGLNNIFSRASSVNGEVNYENGKPGTIANIRVPLGD